MPTLMFVDDHPLYRAGFQQAISRTLADLTIATADSGEGALAQLEAGLDVDFCLADVRLPGMDGFELLEIVAARWPTIARGILCSEPTPALAARAGALGVVGFLSKARDIEGLAEAIDSLFRGVVVYDTDPNVPGSMLSHKRRRILELAARGQSNKQIAHALGVTERTVKDHWTYIFQGLSVSNRAEAVGEAHKRRLI